MKIIAIDPGYDRIGVAVIEKSEATNHKEVLLFSRCIVTDRKQNINERIFYAGQEIERYIDQYQPEILAIENVYFTNNQKTVIHVSEAKGVFMYIALTKGLRVCEYTPLQIKVAITGDGAAKKEQVSYMVPKLIQVNMEQKTKDAGGSSTGLDDEVDAIAIALTCSAHERYH